MKKIIIIIGATLVLSGYVPPKPKTEMVTVCDKNGCYQIQKVVSNE